jgi:hypothetical protein
MSISLMDAAWRNFPGGGSDLLVLLKMADLADDEGGNLFPSIGYLASFVRLSTGQTRRVVHRLIDEGWISVVANSAGGAPGSSRHYHIDVPKLTAGMSARGGASARAGAGAGRGLAPVQETGGAGASQSVRDPLKTHTSANAEVGIAGGPPACPHQQIVDLYHEILPELPRVRLWNKTREGLLRARWRESSKHQSSDFWQRLFEHVRKSDFLMGRLDGTAGRPPFKADLEWLLLPSNFAKIIEGKYHRAGAARSAA